MARPSRYRHWTAQEDTAIRQSAEAGYPKLSALAVDYGRTYFSIRTRASRIGAIRLHRLDPADRPPRGPTRRTCRYCGDAFLGIAGERYCGDVCRVLGRGQCPGCGRALKGLRCSRCAVDGKRDAWPVRC